MDSNEHVEMKEVDDVFSRLEKSGKFCSVCGKPQYHTRSGLTCVNGHGGADSVKQGVE